MYLLKEIKKYEEYECDIVEITLLSIEEYKKYKHLIPLLKWRWWLRSPGSLRNSAAYVSIGGDVYEDGCSVNYGDRAVRPALKIEIFNPESFKPGDKLNFLRKRWTILNILENKLYILCDTDIGYHRFNKECNIWETSELKQLLEEWLKNEIVGKEAESNKTNSNIQEKYEKINNTEAIEILKNRISYMSYMDEEALKQIENALEENESYKKILKEELSEDTIKLLKDKEEFRKWIQRMVWHCQKCNELSEELDVYKKEEAKQKLINTKQNLL